MSDPQPQPYFPGMYDSGAPQYSVNASRPVYAPLPPRQKRAARWAGAIGLNIMSLGGSLITGVAIVGVIALFIAIVSASSEPSSGLGGFGDFLAESNAVLWLAGLALLGLVILAAGMFASVSILQRGGVRRPWAVTWSGFGVCLPVLFVLNLFVSLFVQIVSSIGTVALVSSSFDNQSPDATVIATSVVVGVVLVAFTIVVVAVIGWLAWWWMAHAFRERVPLAGQGEVPSAAIAEGAAGGGKVAYGTPSSVTNGPADDGGD